MNQRTERDAQTKKTASMNGYGMVKWTTGSAITAESGRSIRRNENEERRAYLVALRRLGLYGIWRDVQGLLFTQRDEELQEQKGKEKQAGM